MFLWLFLAAIAAIVIYYFNFQSNRQQIREKLGVIVEKRRNETKQNIEYAKNRANQLDPTVRDKIGSLNFMELKEGLQNGSIKCVDAVLTYYYKAVEANRNTNAICMFVKEAEDWARELDEKAKDPSYQKPPLFGIPISLKECIQLKGYDQTRGFVQDAYRPAQSDSIQVEHFKKLGLIPFCLTNVPQSLLAYNCCNPLYGTTCHPDDPSRTCGGSSGGEGALLGGRGSLVGIGGDVGGSIRIPCHFTGTAGIKPSKMRFAHRGATGSVPGKPMIDSNDGPMAQDVETNVEILKAIWSDVDFQSDRDPYCPPVRWNQEMYESKKKLKIGYYVDDNWFTPTPAIQRAVREAKKILEDQYGYEVVEFKPPRVTEAIQMYFRAVCLDGGQFVLQKLMKDLIEPTIYVQVTLWMVPLWLQRLLSYPMSLIFPRLSVLMKALTRDTFELREAYAGIEQYRDDFFSAMQRNGIDAIICPPQIMAAPQHDIPSKLVSGISYTCLYNLLDYGAGVVPVTKVNKSDEENLNDYPETDKWYQIAKQTSKNTEGLPIGVQVVAPPYREELVLRVMKNIQDGVNRK